MQHTQETVSLGTGKVQELRLGTPVQRAGRQELRQTYQEQATSSWADTSWQIPEGSEARGRRRNAGSVTGSTANRLVQGRQSRQQEISPEKSAGKSCMSIANNLAESE
ncbi:hypothetical protein D9C73_000173 [Collichthys lucidus]|uniref:Uncharacterized protein n=1 Tax=Collichthys lucidus TaxID=240159 RepID=A0A4U5TWS7_COLLU|nr:hypothetical protein D9C73_000173 [Collichthys lucidus]